MSDERLGLPSASMADRMMNCPGSPLTSESAVDSDSAERGDNIHAALSKRNCDALETNEQSVFYALLAGRNAVVDAWIDSRQPGDEVTGTCLDSARFFLRDKTLKRIFSGQPDEILDAKESILVIDYKTGPVASVEFNWQLRAYAVLARAQFGKKPVRAAVIRESGTDVVDWSNHELDLFEIELRYAISAMRPDARRRGGAWCKFCPARKTCSSASVWAITVAAPYAVGERILTPQQMAEIHRNRSAIISILDGVDEALKGMTAEQLSEIGMRRKSNAPMRSITSPVEVIERLKQVGVRESDLMDTVKIGLGDAEKLIAKAMALSGKAAKDKLNEICSGLIEMKPKGDSLEFIP